MRKLALSDEILLIMTTKANTDAIPCATKVAHATPETPQPKIATNNISSAMLPSEEAIKKYSGVFESPNAVKIALHIL